MSNDHFLSLDEFLPKIDLIIQNIKQIDSELKFKAEAAPNLDIPRLITESKNILLSLHLPREILTDSTLIRACVKLLADLRQLLTEQDEINNNQRIYHSIDTPLFRIEEVRQKLSIPVAKSSSSHNTPHISMSAYSIQTKKITEKLNQIKEMLRFEELSFEDEEKVEALLTSTNELLRKHRIPEEILANKAEVLKYTQQITDLNLELTNLKTSYEQISFKHKMYKRLNKVKKLLKLKKLTLEDSEAAETLLASAEELLRNHRMPKEALENKDAFLEHKENLIGLSIELQALRKTHNKIVLKHVEHFENSLKQVSDELRAVVGDSKNCLATLAKDLDTAKQEFVNNRDVWPKAEPIIALRFLKNQRQKCQTAVNNASQKVFTLQAKRLVIKIVDQLALRLPEILRPYVQRLATGSSLDVVRKLDTAASTIQRQVLSY